ncbi:unnamed protein product, partial [Heterosigma akashiwo]
MVSPVPRNTVTLGCTRTAGSGRCRSRRAAGSTTWAGTPPRRTPPPPTPSPQRRSKRTGSSKSGARTPPATAGPWARCTWRAGAPSPWPGLSSTRTTGWAPGRASA